MARQLRIEFPGAFYHVTSRGNQKQAIFLSDDDRRFFLKCLGDANVKFGALIHAYCLMDTHYHLLLETPSGNLSRILHLLNTTYSIYFNKKWERCGHPFQGRFKAILVQAEQYARELAAYIHLNPVRAGLVDSPEKYEWSNYTEYLGLGESHPWEVSSLVLSCFGNRREEARLRYAEYVLWRSGQKLPHPLDPAKPTGILGSPDFIERTRRAFLGDDQNVPEREVPQSRKPKVKPDLSTVVAAADTMLRGKNKLARKVAIFISHKNTDYTLKELGEFFRMSVSTVSETCRYVRKSLQFNKSLSRVVDVIQREAFGGMTGKSEPTIGEKFL